VAPFVHLHVHSQYSMLEGAIRVKDLCARVKDLGMSAVAVTDHGNMHGAIEFYQKATASGVQPILGCELPFAFAMPGDKPDKHGRMRSYHLPVLARTAEGYKNLIALVSHAWLDPDGDPQSTLERLHDHRKGLVVLTGCLGGILPQSLLQHGPRVRAAGDGATARDGRARRALRRAAGARPRRAAHRQPHPRGHGAGGGLPLVATNDCHYLRARVTRRRSAP
jgi:DNA polymerase-3 subunit alpha